METIEDDLSNAELELEKAQSLLEDSDITSNHEKLQEVMKDIDTKKKRVEELYKMWEEIEKKIRG